jgi:hypothetical protein
MLAMENRLVDQIGDVRVVKRICHGAPTTLADNKPEVPQHAQLMRNRRPLHFHSLGELVDGAGAVT